MGDNIETNETGIRVLHSGEIALNTTMCKGVKWLFVVIVL